MAHSLNEKCTPLKKEYDNCFNAWFEGYLEPAVATTDQARSEFSKRKAQEFQDKCGPVWNSYRECVQQAVKDKGLDTLLQAAREENPLTETDTRSPPQDPQTK
ncbi:mitochondrial distribution/morphology family 35/apoptosis [Schizophyllum commune]|uniref:Mitochondrial distribution and morphology protein 35 n=1 Tax=Schizophyllum commune (strain H4-8 / FGSC 9210) TaxID=578458 RepID=D8QE00_SCHCM|nr:uncharacterized protein SCHCODRAFT_02636901 [Schizophyllum commune H4-8]KAI5888506.1 hypothetical protein SCHCODRAFT_02636901 [Schizophyllum commune H4-8]